MYCQKCRTPLKVDASIEDLNPAAFDLLIGSTGKSLPDPSSKSAPRPPFPPERQQLYNQVSQRATSPVYSRTLPAPRNNSAGSLAQSRVGVKDGPGMSFVMLSESQVVPAHAAPTVNGYGRQGSKRGSQSIPDTQSAVDDGQTYSHQIEKTAHLFDIISARSDIDHPICTECTDMLVDGLKKRLQTATKERDAYISFLKNLNNSIPAPEEVQAAEDNLKATVQAEEKAFQELLALEKEKAAVDIEIAELEDESRQLDLEEEQFWRERNGFALTLSEFQNERDGLNMKYDHDSRQLERLQRTNVYNDTFCISHDGYFGTINGLRLGRLANPSVEWAEINAAWGQTLLLLATIAEKLGFQFQGYRLKPMGSTSKIDKIEYPQQPPNQSSPNTTPNRATHGTNQPDTSPPAKITSLDLYSSGDLPLNLPRLHRRFDAGMVAFLECLRQIGKYVETTPTGISSPPQSPSSQRHPRQANTDEHSPAVRALQAQIIGFKLPYEIKRDKIGDASIKLGFNQNDETWTRACKRTLTCCKYLLAHASNVTNPGNHGGASAPPTAAIVPGR
ncbi:autophagy protein 6 [Onygenales sp. PD_40]|nr:autophagy protein 6 [Onygenales sp. PD_40]KAK2780861.1 autophagy protein 6 [Emmonsiellopsis sp. PD_33]KAK2793678.1 autophagy protein 6 [Onygenales sp. PD_12]KAK2804770.1 autophagy protein 6 [Onygenales sp. PD_10]